MKITIANFWYPKGFLYYLLDPHYLHGACEKDQNNPSPSRGCGIHDPHSAHRCCRMRVTISSKMHCTSPIMMVQESACLASLIRPATFTQWKQDGPDRRERLKRSFVHTRILAGPAGSNQFSADVNYRSASLKTCGRSDLEVERRRCNWYYCGFGSSLNDNL